MEKRSKVITAHPDDLKKAMKELMRFMSGIDLNNPAQDELFHYMWANTPNLLSYEVKDKTQSA